MGEVQKNRISSVNIVFLVTILISVIVPFLPLEFLWERPTVQILLSQGLIAAPAIVYMVINRLPYKETVRLKKMKVVDMLLALLFGILIQPAISLINALSMVVASNTTGATMLGITEKLPFLGGIFLLAVVPAVMEESVYRGVFYHEYSKVNPWKAALLSGLLFGVMHGNLNQFSYAAVMGIVFALLVEATDSILSTMLVHFWTNASSVVMLYLYPKLYQLAQSFYEMYREYGNETMATMLETAFGDLTQSAEEWTRQTLEAASMLELTVPQVLTLYGPQALLMGAAAVWVYRKLAIRSGNWERICSSFRTQKPLREESETSVTLEIEPKQRLITIPLVIALVIGIAYMFLFEVLIQRTM